MIWVDRLSERIARYVISKDSIPVTEDMVKIEGIKQEIDILRELKIELVLKDKEIERQRLEWDRTFDSIIDNICIIGSDQTIEKVNKSFLTCVREQRGPWDSLVGMPWQEFREDVGMPSEIDLVIECFDTSRPAEALVDMRNGV